MATDIKQNFFESFNIPKRFYTIVNFGDLDNNYQEVSAGTLKELFEDYNWHLDEYVSDIKDFTGYEEKYPEITAEIILELEKIVSKSADYVEICIDSEGYQLEYVSGERALCSCCCEFDYDKRFIVDANNFEDLILISCIQIKDESEIQNKVQQLFKKGR